ncbi:NAD-dependent epimerase/dehydratase family protein [Luteimonas gilva]|uniref:NAD-dependent epimerase/dehydratase family protein n=2 Tax=Luteimonas gilva TaxID=2572684 RepID=A0A4U5JQK4_9GAMM|nr:NAD-dependent epimerase/dehydratase family protein [Luteimonas gilva]
MYVVMGATGHVGSSVASNLLAQKQAVVVVTRDAAKAEEWRGRGADACVIDDVRSVDQLRQAFKRGRRAFLLNPPAPIDTDTDREERETVRCILEALQDSGLEKVVAESTGGAQPGERCGDLNVLYEFEQGLERQPIPAHCIRAAYYYSNFDGMLGQAKRGRLPSMYPADLKIPMAAPEDLGKIAARLLQESPADTGVTYAEGPERYSFADAALAFQQALGRPVALEVLPRTQWEEAFRELGFSPAAADSYARMTAATADSDFEVPGEPARGAVTLRDYIALLVEAEG